MSIPEHLESSLQAITGQFRPEIFAYIQRKIGNAATAEDLTQETFVKSAAHWRKGPSRSIFVDGSIKSMNALPDLPFIPGNRTTPKSIPFFIKLGQSQGPRS
jgi:hypothetical protein